MRTRKEPVSFLSALLALNAAHVVARDATIAALAAAPESDEWLATMSSPDVAEALGALMQQASKNAAWANGAINDILTAIGSNMPGAVDSVEANFVKGQVAAEMACPCGTCDACASRAKDGDEKARRSILKTLTPKRKKSGAVQN